MGDDEREGLRGFTTRAVHRDAGDTVQRPSSVPLYQTSTWRFDTLDQFADVIAGARPGQVYGRGYGNPTVEAFESAMADLERTGAAFALDSGMAAIHCVVTTLARSGSRVVASRHLYGGTYSLFANVLPRYGIEVVFVDPFDEAAVTAALPGAALLYVETIDNPLLSVADLGRLAALCRSVGVASVVDNTFASPYLCNPAALGVDYVLHSATKYIGGHSDLLGGVVCSTEDGRRALRATAIETGGAMQPFEAWLCLRGLATLALRMDRHCGTAQRLAELLAASPVVSSVHYPGLAGDPHHEVASRELRAYGGMVAFELAGGMDAARRFCAALRLGWIAASLGGPHTLVAHPASTTHRQIDPGLRAAQGLTDGLVRVSVGLEDTEDVLADFGAALASI
ncbi:MAG TPA: aminotransferase class I/II-fold pyridoxal phosphate-dependent enzyme [Acidimicrobiales bacterium]|nr:aminotransferase class I/II-fold pyridoxal phosphate-dependent enzyme [Acidimicrobiales bacterium]